MKQKIALILIVILSLSYFTAFADDDARQSDFIYEYAYKRICKDYTIYFVFDMDKKIARNFVTNDLGVISGTITGSLETEIKIRYTEEWVETFRLKNLKDRRTAILIDHYGFEFEYEIADVEEAESVLRQDGYHDIEL